MRFSSTPHPSTIESVARSVDGWSSSEAMRELVRTFGGGELPTLGLHDRLAWLDDFSSVWDYRGGAAERDQQRIPTLNEREIEIAFGAAEALGLMEDTSAVAGDFDHVLILGGLVRGCFNRTRAAAALIRSGAVKTKSVTALCGFRLLSGADDKPVANPPSEVELAEMLGFAQLRDEFEAMDESLRSFFHRGEPDSVDGVESDNTTRRWRLHEYRSSSEVLRTLAAPSTAPTRRADTADSCAFYAERIEKLKAGASILLVTTAIYVPYQNAVALRALARPYGVSVTTIGVTGRELGEVDPRLAQEFRPDNYLAEIRSSIRGYRTLVDDVVPR